MTGQITNQACTVQRIKNRPCNHVWRRIVRAIHCKRGYSSLFQSPEISYDVFKSDIGWTSTMEYVSCDDHELRLQFDGFVYDFSKCHVEIFTSNVQIILCITQMQISDVNKTERLQRSTFSSNNFCDKFHLNSQPYQST